jgi:putative tricarboxylic transport membrane protein
MGYDRVGGVIWLVLGIVICIGSTKLGLGAFHRPGPGFMPFLAGSLLGVLGCILTLTKTQKGLEKKEDGEISIRKFLAKGVFAFIVSFMYIFLLEPLGFVVGTFLLFFSLLKIMGTRKWFSPFLISFFAVVLSYFVFIVWLKISFPKGVFK